MQVMRPWGHDFCPPGEATSGQRLASGALLFTWFAISSPGRQNSAFFGANYLNVDPEALCLKVASQRDFLRMNS